MSLHFFPVVAKNNGRGSLSSSLGDLSSGRAFDNGCMCYLIAKINCTSSYPSSSSSPPAAIAGTCHCQAPRLKAELLFVDTLVGIGKRLGRLGSKDAKTQGLNAELCRLNLNLPAKVWLPFKQSGAHFVVRIPPQAAVVLNSKDKVKQQLLPNC
jgi:phosphatidylinositol 4-kinase